MNTITRRGVMAAFASLPAAAAAAQPIEPERTLEEQARWHIDELHRLIAEAGGGRACVLATGMFRGVSGEKECKLIGLNTDGVWMNEDGMFAEKGGAA